MRKFKICLLMLLLCFSLTGCAIEDLYDSVKDGSFANNVQDTLSTDSKLQMSKSTFNQMQSLVKAQSDAAQTKATVGSFNNVPILGWFTKGFCNMKDALATAEFNKYETTKASDSIYQKSLAESKGEGGLNVNVKQIILIVAVVAVILLMLAMLMKKKKPIRKPAPVAQPAHQPIPMPAPIQQVQPIVVQPQVPVQPEQPYQPRQGPDGRQSNLEVDYEKLLHRNCEQLGMDYDAVLEKYEGNIMEAWKQTWLLLPNK